MSHFYHSQFGSFIPGFDANTIWFADSFIPLEAIIPWEVWKSISGCLWYEVSSFGRIRSYFKNRRSQEFRETPFIMKQKRMKNHCGRMEAGLSFVDSGTKSVMVHRLVLEAFSPPSDLSLVCRHVDGNASNNHISNLRWGTHKENVRDMFFHGTSPRGEKCYSAKLTTDQVIEIRRRLANGEVCHRLAKEYGVGKTQITRIKNRHKWKHI